MDYGFEDEIKKCINVLKVGGIILYPTDTVWGIGCDALNINAIEKIYTIKHRPKDKSMIVLLAEARDILNYVAIPPPDIISIIENFETPTSVIYDNVLGFPEQIVKNDGSLAIRITNDIFCKALIKRYKRPIVSTSANISGRMAPTFFKDIDKEIKDNMDYIVQYRQNDIEYRKPSRLVKINDDGILTVLRD